MTFKHIKDMSDREKTICLMSKETGYEYMQSRWQNVNARIIAELPGATVDEGLSAQFNSAINDMAYVIIAMQDFAIDHEINLGTNEEMQGNFAIALKDCIEEILSSRKARMN